MKINGKIIGFVLAGLVMLPGCLRVPTYKAKPLNVLNNNFAYREIKNNIVFQAKCLAHGEIYYLFGERTKELLKSTEIIYCSVHNISNQDYIFSLKNKHFSPLSVPQVTQLIKTSSAGRLATGIAGGTGISVVANGLFAGGLCLWLGGYAGLVIPYQLIFGVPIAFTFGSLIFFGKGIKSMIMNSRIKKDLNEKMLQDNVIIKSGDKHDGLIFVKASDYTSHFTMMMHEKNNHKNRIVFDVDLSTDANR